MAVAFGDRPSGAIATLALRQTATLYQHIYPDASKMVIRNSYVDDILQSVDNVEEARRIAQETETMRNSNMSDFGIHLIPRIFSGPDLANFILVFTIPLYSVSVPEIIQCLIENPPNASIVSVS
jgi:hypothetical protein